MAGGTVLAAILAVLAVFSHPPRERQSPLHALWDGRAPELSFFNSRFDVKMYLYVVGGWGIARGANMQKYTFKRWPERKFLGLISRQRFDDRYCAEKYGEEKWAEYRARVRWRIIPGVY